MLVEGAGAGGPGQERKEGKEEREEKDLPVTMATLPARRPEPIWISWRPLFCAMACVGVCDGE